MNIREIEDTIKQFQGKSIALVYSFRNEDENEFSYYDYWKSETITDWLKAIEEIGCIPFISDVRTFSIKALEKSLPKIDIVVNLNAGNKKIESLGLVHSICGVLNIPCIPNSLESVVTGEQKHYSNLIAKSLGLNVPDYIDKETHKNEYICRPVNYGSSYGVTINSEAKVEHIKQRFIRGYDITTPILYDPFSGGFKFLPSVYYVPDSMSPDWIHSFTTKDTSKGFKRKYIDLDGDSKNLFISIVKAYGIIDYCRIDCRIKCDSYEEFLKKLDTPIKSKDLFFLEINAMPTIGEGTSFIESLDSAHETCQIHSLCSKLFGKFSTTTVVLVSSILSRRKRL